MTATFATRWWALICLAGTGLEASAQDVALSSQDVETDIVVTGPRLDHLEALHSECLASACTPLEDMRRSLELADQLFLAGDYRRSREVLALAIDRNKKHAESYPVLVAGLYRGQSRVAEHLGYRDEHRLLVLRTRNVLARGLGKNAAHTLASEIAVADSRARAGYPREAARKYAAVQRRAEQNDLAAVAIYAQLRLIVYRWETEGKRSKRAREAILRELDGVASAPPRGAESFAMAARVLAARLRRETGDMTSTDALIASLAGAGGTQRPLLVRAEQLPRLYLDDTPIGRRDPPRTIRRSATARHHGRWADIGFWVGADGRVSEVEILRSHGTTKWLDVVTANIGARRYLPLQAADGEPHPGRYLIERYTVTADLAANPGTIGGKKRGSTLVIRRLDITPAEADAGPAGQS